MEKIIKKIEVEQEFYVAYDGTEFNDEDECAYYEDEFRRTKILCYDSNMKKCDFEDAEWVVVRNDEDFNNIADTCEFNGWDYAGICENGIYNRSAYGWNEWKKVVFPVSIKNLVEFSEE